MIFLFDATNPGNIPTSAQIVAGYIDGLYADYNGMLARFPNAEHVSITVTGQAGARVCDCETGDLSPQQAASWAKEEVGNHRRPTIYCNLSTHPDVVSALSAEGLTFSNSGAGGDVDWWAAGYTNSPYLAPGSVATQFEGGISAPYDLSETNGHWPVPNPVPVVNPAYPSGCIGMAVDSSGEGYWLAYSDGKVTNLGNATNEGSLGGHALNAPITAICRSPNGFWLAGSDGGVFAFGDATFHGSAGNTHLVKPVVDMAARPDNGGYWLAASDGGVFAFGNAPYDGSEGGKNLAAGVVGIAASSTGDGYWLTGADGGVFAFGDAGFHGSLGSDHLKAPIVGIASVGNGYWLVGADGGVFSFNLPFYGSTGNLKLAQPIEDIVASASGHGYYLIARDGGVFCFGDAEFVGSGA